MRRGGAAAVRLGGGPPHRGEEVARGAGGHRGDLSDFLARFPLGGPEAPCARGCARDGPLRSGLQWPEPCEHLDDETDSERSPVFQERPPGDLTVHQGRASHHRLGTNIPLQLELTWAKHGASGTWFMLGRVVDVVAERTPEGHLLVRSASGGMDATLSGRWVAPDRLAGGFWLGADGDGAFELRQCPQVSVLAEAFGWCPPGRVSSATPPPASLLPARVPPGRCAGQAPGQEAGPAAGGGDDQLVFITEAQLAEGLAEVLKNYPSGLDLAQIRPIIHRSTGRWVSEALLGYKKLIYLITSPTMSRVCWIQRVGSCNRVMGHGAAASQPSDLDVGSPGAAPNYYYGGGIMSF